MKRLIQSIEQNDHGSEIAFRRSVFTAAERETLAHAVPHLPAQGGEVMSAAEGGTAEDAAYRRTVLRWIPQPDGPFHGEWLWLYEKLTGLVVSANQELWRYRLTHCNDGIQHTQYHASEQGHYDWHMDMGAGAYSQRKLTIVVQLNAPEEYEGGQLQLLRNREPFVAPQEANFATIFPGWMLHRVTPVTKGLRESLVLWVCGPPLR